MYDNLCGAPQTSRQSNNDDGEIVARHQSGDGDAFQILYERYKGKVKTLSRSYYLMGGDSDDVMQEGMLGLFKAANTFDPNQGASFKTFAYLCINSNLKSAVKRASSNKNKTLNDSLDISQMAEILTSLIDPEEELIKGENAEELDKKLDDILSKFERDILRCFLEGLSYVQIAERVNCDEKAVDNALSRIRKKLNKI